MDRLCSKGPFPDQTGSFICLHGLLLPKQLQRFPHIRQFPHQNHLLTEELNELLLELIQGVLEVFRD
jgi:hypothetical protein